MAWNYQLDCIGHLDRGSPSSRPDFLRSSDNHVTVHTWPIGAESWVAIAHATNTPRLA